MEIENASSISILPAEALMDVFEFLETRDRNNAKLVCKLWLGIFRHSCFSHMEAFSFPEYFDFSTILQFVDRCHRDKLNLKFRGRRILPNSKFFWQKCGNKINSLKFERCSFEPHALSQIFENCVNLEEFITSDYCEISVYRESQRTPKSFQQCEVDHLLREKLLKLDVSSLPSSSADLICIASIFPNLKILDIKLMNNVNSCLSTLRELLATKMLHIEKLNIRLPDCTRNFSENVSGLQKCVSSNRTAEISWALRLEVVAFTESNIGTISSIRFLTSLQLSNRVTDMTLLSRFINENPKLQDLHVHLPDNKIRDFCSLWTALMNSRLKFLKVYIDSHARSQLARHSTGIIDSALDSLTRNYTVRDLIVLDDYGNEFYFLFAKYFQGVISFTILDAYPSTIFQHRQTQLRYFKMNAANYIFIENSTPISIPSIEYVSISYNVVDLLSYYRFPNLMYLDVEFHEAVDSYIHPMGENELSRLSLTLFSDDLKELASKLLLYSPKFRGVHISCHVDQKETFKLFFEFCRNFPNLRYMYFTSKSLVPEESDLMEDVTEFVNKSSSVKVVWIQTGRFKILYVFNPVTGEYEFRHQFSEISRQFNRTLKDVWENKR